MASQFIGLYMRVVLREPYAYTLTGKVQNVEAGNSLTLVDVSTLAADGSHQPTNRVIRIDATKILDLSEVKVEDKPPTYAPPPTDAVAAPVSPQAAQQAAFVDPAIVSLGRRPNSSTPSNGGPRRSPMKAVTVEAPSGQPLMLPTLFQAKASEDAAAARTPVSPVPGTNTEPATGELDNGTAEAHQSLAQKKKKTRSKRTQHHKSQSLEDSAQAAEIASAANIQSNRGKGWRQTPILQSTASFQPFNSLKRNGKGRIGINDNGWASEEVTEEMGDFDFENNLAKFDKRTVFDQIRKDDEIEDADRLVSHNRRPRPLTAGGKNLHPSENVLDLPSTTAQSADFWNSEADVGVDGDARPRRAESRPAGSRRSQSRKASAVAGTSSVVASGGLPLSRVNSNQTSKQGRQPGLYLVPSNYRVEAISTLQMLNLENIAANELGFTEDLMSENAGRGIAEVAMTALSDPALKVRFDLAVAGSAVDVSASNSSVVVMASNNKSSIRALAAARQLHNKNINVVVCLVGMERERDLLEDLRRQIQLYRNFGGKVLNKSDFFEYLRKGTPSGGKISVSLIIDALLGLTISFEELRVGDQATVYELMEWANRNEAFVLSVDIPTGIDPSSGKVAIIDGGHLFVKPRYVVAIGVPKRGLLEAVTPTPQDEPGAAEHPAQEDEWRLFIADLGLGSAVWRKAGTKMRRGVDFNGKWVLEMRYRGASDEPDYGED